MSGGQYDSSWLGEIIFGSPALILTLLLASRLGGHCSGVSFFGRHIKTLLIPDPQVPFQPKLAIRESSRVMLSDWGSVRSTEAPESMIEWMLQNLKSLDPLGPQP